MYLYNDKVHTLHLIVELQEESEAEPVLIPTARNSKSIALCWSQNRSFCL